ncbi:MAG: GNAT family N-acetyltransferase [Bacillota bacterium]|nr:GNAT family N-acetyltransferase [Bacillota bacterium]
MSYSVTEESFGSLASCYEETRHELRWDPLFILPGWMQVWWQQFDPGTQLQLLAVRHDGQLLGIAPLQIEGGTASMIGSIDVTDYVDFVVSPGREETFFNVLLDHLKEKGASCLDLGPLRPESSVLMHLVNVARGRGYAVRSELEDVSLELGLPPTWDGYLAALSKKQRHEVRRKLNRIHEAGEVSYRTLAESNAIREAMDVFLKMFTESRNDKEAYLTARREAFFRSIAATMADWGLARIGVLDFNSQPAAMILFFIHNNTVHLYNSGYDPNYRSLSAGLMSKVFCIRDSIEKGMQKFDFLKGNEEYKHRLGGMEVPLYRCHIDIK